MTLIADCWKNPCTSGTSQRPAAALPDGPPPATEQKSRRRTSGVGLNCSVLFACTPSGGQLSTHVLSLTQACRS